MKKHQAEALEAVLKVTSDQRLPPPEGAAVLTQAATSSISQKTSPTGTTPTGFPSLDVAGRFLNSNPTIRSPHLPHLSEKRNFEEL